MLWLMGFVFATSPRQDSSIQEPRVAGTELSAGFVVRFRLVPYASLDPRRCTMFGTGGAGAHEAVIGVGSVVTRDLPPRVFAAGNPCRVMWERNGEG
jgi:hypothetical protein